MAIVVVGLSACGDYVNCVTPPCALPMALTITVTSAATAGPVNGAVVQVDGPMMGTTPCAGSCVVSGYAGTYNLDITAPGFQAASRSVTVTGSAPAACGCGSTNTVHVDVSLVAGS